MAGSRELTIDAMSTKVVLNKRPRRTWFAQHVLTQALATAKISPRKVQNVERIRPVIDVKLRKAAYYEVPVDLYKSTTVDDLVPGGSLPSFALRNGVVAGKAYPKTLSATYMANASDLDTSLPANGNEGLVDFLANEKLAAIDALVDLVEQRLCAATQATAPAKLTIDSLLATVFTDDTAFLELDPDDHSTWIAKVVDMNGARIRLSHVKEWMRYMGARGKKIDCLAADETVANYLIAEAEQDGQKVIDMVQAFGTNPQSGENNLYLETSIPTIKIEGAPLVPVPAISSSAPGTLLGFELANLPLCTVGDFIERGPEDVSLSAGVDQTRGAINISLFVAALDRSGLFTLTNGKA